jgi:NADH pyrophosphatase NudC (nudix superfamily)
MYLRSQNIPTPKSMMIKLIQTIRMQASAAE